MSFVRVRVIYNASAVGRLNHNVRSEVDGCFPYTRSPLREDMFRCEQDDVLSSPGWISTVVCSGWMVRVATDGI